MITVSVRMVLVCDGCRYREEYNGAVWQDLVRAARRDGWSLLGDKDRGDVREPAACPACHRARAGQGAVP